MFLRGLAVFVVLDLVFANSILAQKPAIDTEKDYGLPAVVVVLSELTGRKKIRGLYPIIRFPSFILPQATIQKQFCYRGENHEERVVLLTLHDKNKKLIAPGLVGIVFGDRIGFDPNSGEGRYVDRWMLINHGLEWDGEFSRRWSTFVPKSGTLSPISMIPVAAPLFKKLCRYYQLFCPGA